MLHRAWFEISRDSLDLLASAHERAPDDPRIAGTYAIALARALINDATGIHDADHARSVVARALALDAKSGEARCAMGLLKLADGDAVGATEAFVDALAAAPSSVDALDALGRMLNEAGRPDRGVDLLQRALAIEPTLNQARFQMARVRSPLRDVEGFFELMGPAPAHPGDYVPWLLLQARIFVWWRDVASAERLARIVASAVGLPPAVRNAVHGMLGVTRTGSAPDAVFAETKRTLPVDARRSKRRGAFNAQLLTEISAATGRIDGAFEALAAADANAIFDVSWMDHCAALDVLRADPRFASIRESIAARAAAILAVVDRRGIF